MKYVLLAYAEPEAWDEMTDEERTAWVADDAAFNAHLADLRCVVHGEGLADGWTATTVRIKGGEVVVTDGPAADARRCSVGTWRSTSTTSTLPSPSPAGRRRHGPARSRSGPSACERVIEEAYRREWAGVVATLARSFGLDVAEEAAADAFAAAVERWPTDGVPDNPGAWLTTAGRRKALDRVRRESTAPPARRRPPTCWRASLGATTT